MDIQNSYTSSSDPRWRTFVLTLISTLVLLIIISYSFILIIDPYDNLSFSAKLDRVPVARQQRLFYPALARKAYFDSAIIGNSNIRLLRPQQFNTLLDGQFVNLGMDAASSWEQQQIFDVFVRQHKKINNIVIGLDYLWCYPEYADEKFVGANSVAGFPQWMYDENTLNDFPPLNLISLEHAWLQLLSVTGLKTSPYRLDGYHVFTGPMSEYDLNKARINIYGSRTPKARVSVEPPLKLSPNERKQLLSPALHRLQSMLGSLPDNTRKVLMFSPYHRYFQAASGSRNEIVWQDCKNRVAVLAKEVNNAFVVDFMIDSEITSNDHNYWDYKHYNVGVAQLLGTLMKQAILGGSNDSRYVLLYPLQRDN